MSFSKWLLAAAKSHQSYPTLCNPRDGSPPGSPIPGVLQARTLERVAISFSSAWKWKVKVKSLSHVRLLATPWTVTYQAPLSMGFPRQEYWSGLPLPSPSGYLGAYKCKNSSSCMLKIYSFMDLSLITSKPFIFKRILFFFKLFIYLAAPGLNWGTWESSVFIAAFEIFSGSIVPCGMWDLIPRPGIEPASPLLQAWSLCHWTTREVPPASLFLTPATLLTPN